MIQSKLISAYYAMSNTTSFLYKNCLVEDPNKEEIDIDATIKKTKEFIKKEDKKYYSKHTTPLLNGKYDNSIPSCFPNHPNDHILKKHRRAVSNWLYSICWNMNHLTDQWLWEMNHRIRKLLIISIALERCNLMSIPGYKGEPNPEDCPQYIPYIWALLESKKDTFNEMKKGYRKMIANHPIYSYYCYENPKKKKKLN